MAQERPNRIVEWMHVLRARVPLAAEQLESWMAGIREEPALLWHTAAVRYAAYGLGAVLVLWTVHGAIALLAPPPPPNARATAHSADFYCLCSQPSCGHRFVIHRPFGFDDFPVACPKCTQQTGFQARPCYSSVCRGTWVIPLRRKEGTDCPLCGAKFD